MTREMVKEGTGKGLATGDIATVRFTGTVAETGQVWRQQVVVVHGMGLCVLSAIRVGGGGGFPLLPSRPRSDPAVSRRCSVIMRVFAPGVRSFFLKVFSRRVVYCSTVR